MGKPKELVVCEPSDVAEWIGLKDASLLGTRPIELPQEAVDELRKFRSRGELTTKDAAAILRCTTGGVLFFTAEARNPRLGHRYASARKLVIPAADIAAFITQRAKPPVPTTGKAPTADVVATLKAVADARKRHNLPPV